MEPAQKRQVGFKQPVIDPRDPGGAPAVVTIPCDLIQRWYKYQSVDYENLETAKFVLEHPQRILGGVRDYEEGGYCYLARPSQWYVKSGVLAPFPAQLVFGVYVNPNLWLYEIQAEKTDKQDILLPINWKTRYREGLLWTRDIS